MDAKKLTKSRAGLTTHLTPVFNLPCSCPRYSRACPPAQWTLFEVPQTTLRATTAASLSPTVRDLCGRLRTGIWGCRALLQSSQKTCVRIPYRVCGHKDPPIPDQTPFAMRRTGFTTSCPALTFLQISTTVPLIRHTFATNRIWRL